MQFIRDEDIKTAFVTMMNKLIYGQKFILRPLLNGLRNQNNVASFRRIEELETKIDDKELSNGNHKPSYTILHPDRQ